MTSDSQAQGPDLEAGIHETELADGAMIVGHVGDEPVLLARRGGEVFAIGATCTHYGGPLGQGLMVGETVRCPWHHACFSLRTGEAVAAPALGAVSCWRVRRTEGRIMVTGPAEAPVSRPAQAATSGQRFVIVGGGAAGFAAAEMLRREGYDGALTMVSSDTAAPYDRPNLSKDYLAGSAPQDWIPLRPDSFYTDNRIDLRLATRVASLDPKARLAHLDGGTAIGFDRLLLATGAEPVRLDLPGADLPHVRTLRSLDDCRAIIALARPGTRAIVIGASFIGLEAAAALRAREVEVGVVAPETRPMERTLGPDLGDFLRGIHEEHGVRFHLGRTVTAIEPGHVRLDDGGRLAAELVLVGIGVRPRLELAEQAGLATDHGVLVDEYLQTSSPGIFAAGDIARWPDPYSGERLRIEHWVVAERQGQTAARNMLGGRERYAAPPFFWTQQYDVVIDYVGHAAGWDALERNGDPAARDLALRYRRGGRTAAVATIFRGQESLTAERAMEQGVSP